MHSHARAAKFAVLSLVALLVALIPVSPLAAAPDHDVIIIGAGAAGLYASYELTDLGYDVLVLEARPRHGGRVHKQEQVGSTWVDPIAEDVTGDATAHWHYWDIENYDPNLLVSIYTETKNDNMLYSIGGSTVLSTDATDPELYDYWDFYNEQSDYTGSDVDIESYLCDTLGMCRGDNDFHLYRGAFPGGEWCTPIDEIGMRSLAEQENLWTMGGGSFGFAYSSWIETLDELYFDSIMHTVQLNSTVTDIDTSGAFAEVSAVAAKCSDCHASPGPGLGPIPGSHGRTVYTANAVVVTLPLGVLQAGDVIFTPSLPAEKQAAIDLLGMGNGGKLFLQFSSRFWDAGTTMFFTEGEADFCWSYKYKGGDGDAVLVCYVVGENAEVLDTVGTEAQQIAHVLSDLDAMYPGTPFSDAYVSGSGYWKRMDGMRNSQGCYSFPTPGSYPTDGSDSAREILAEPVGTALYFAGEATHNAWSATVGGAMDSGLRAAGEIDAYLPEPTGELLLATGVGVLLLLRRLSRRG